MVCSVLAKCQRSHIEPARLGNTALSLATWGRWQPDHTTINLHAILANFKQARLQPRLHLVLNPDQNPD